MLKGIVYTKQIKQKMSDIFDNQILCRKCNKVMNPELVSKNGFNLRALKCSKCRDIIVHPVDKQEYDEFIRLKKKDFEVKMRMVGNSYAVSIPREIVDFMKEQEKIVDDMVRLSFQDAHRLSLNFNTPEENNSRVVRSKEVRVVRNNKPILHTKEFYDSEHPEKSGKKVIKSNKFDEGDLEDGR